MTSLITRLRELKGPDRAVDDAIIESLHPGCEWRPWRQGARKEWLHDARGNTVLYGRHTSPHFTASIDAALTLVPEGMAATVGQNVHHSYWGAHVLKLNEDGFPETAGYSGPRSTPAIALCIAALQARGVK